MFMTASGSEPSRRGRKRERTRSAISDAAIRLFSERGFGAPTIDDITEAADVSKGTFYNHFQSKEEILVAFMADLEARLAPDVERFADAPGPLEKILVAYQRHQFKAKEPYFPFVRVLIGAMVRGQIQMDYLARISAHASAPLDALLRRLKQRGLLKRGTDVQTTLFALQYMMFGATCFWAVTGPSWTEALKAFAAQVSPYAKTIEGNAK